MKKIIIDANWNGDFETSPFFNNTAAEKQYQEFIQEMLATCGEDWFGGRNKEQWFALSKEERDEIRENWDAKVKKMQPKSENGKVVFYR